MKTIIRSAIGLSALAAIFILVSATSAQPLGTGGYKVIDKTDVGANTAADFAVKERSTKTKTKYTLGELVKAEDQELKGMNRNFRLCMTVSSANKPASVQAIVSVDQYSNFKLLSWAGTTCTAADNFKPIDKADAGAGLAADFAVKERSATSRFILKLVEIVNAEDQEPKLMTRNFRLCLRVTANGKPSVIRAVVSMDQYSNLKLVSWAASTCGN